MEGLCQGIDEDLVARTYLYVAPLAVLIGAVLGKWVRIPTTYAGGGKGEAIVIMAVIAFRIYVKIFRT